VSPYVFARFLQVALSTSVGEGDRSDALDHLSQVGSSGVLMQFVAVFRIARNLLLMN
jgi:hypothetical protein